LLSEALPSFLQHPNFGNSAATFADVLTSSYGLGIPDYGDDSDMAGGVADTGSHHAHHHGLGDAGHCLGSYHGSDQVKIFCCFG
jgi:hypothetical protein